MRVGSVNLAVIVRISLCTFALSGTAYPALGQARSIEALSLACTGTQEPVKKVERCSNLIGGTRDKRFLERGYRGRGNANVALKRYEDAVADFTKVIALNPRLAGYYDNRLNALRSIGRLNEALSDADSAVRLAPTLPFVHRSRALVFADMGRFEQAVLDFNTAIALAPTDFGLVFDRGIVFGRAGRLQNAIDDFTQVLRADPANLDAHRERGLLFARLGKHDLARADLSLVASLRPEDLEVRNLLRVQEGTVATSRPPAQSQLAQPPQSPPPAPATPVAAADPLTNVERGPATEFKYLLSGEWIETENEHAMIRIDETGRVWSPDGSGYAGRVREGATEGGGNFTFSNENVTCGYDVVWTRGWEAMRWNRRSEIKHNPEAKSCPRFTGFELVAGSRKVR